MTQEAWKRPQQAAFHPSGNGIKGQTRALSFAAGCAARKIGKCATIELSPGATATAVRTTSSN
jgi:hypothetical protein